MVVVVAPLVLVLRGEKGCVCVSGNRGGEGGGSSG